LYRLFHAAYAQGFPALWLMVLDAAGLALFAVAGVEKAMLFAIRPFVAALMGTVTGVVGGVVKDVLLARIPSVLVTDIYATAAFFSAVVVLMGRSGCRRRRAWRAASRASRCAWSRPRMDGICRARNLGCG
jgi:uncharacterized membrane protein YeiH